jgi:hypothetical protein
LVGDHPKEDISQIWLQVKGKGKPVICWQQLFFFFFGEFLQLGESFLRKYVCLGGGRGRILVFFYFHVLESSQIWLNYLIDDRRFSYIRKLGKKNIELALAK